MDIELWFAELAAKNSDGVPFTVSRTYSLNTRGKNILANELEEWSAGAVLPAAAKKQFDPEATFLGKSCIATVVHEMEDGVKVAKLKSYAPNPDGKLAVSSTFVRRNAVVVGAESLTIQEHSEPAQAAASPQTGELVNG